MLKTYFYDVSELDDDAIFEKYMREVSEYRKAKTEKMRFRKDKKLSLGAGILIGRGLCEFGLRECDMVYGTRENGKPFFENAPELRFNVSHSGTMVMCAFSDVEVGCDIEKIAEADMKIARRFFCEEEFDAIANAADRDVMFCRFWTLKESFMKCTGLGMKLPLNAFCIHLGDEITVTCDSVEGEFEFKEFDTEGYCAAVCTNSEFGIIGTNLLNLCRGELRSPADIICAK